MPKILPDCDISIPQRMPHIICHDPGCPELPSCNVQTVPGDMTERGCTFAGCRGVVGGPVKDVIQLVHGPIGCAYYTWGTRRNLSDNTLHRKYCFSTDLTEDAVIYGGGKKLSKAIDEASELFPEAKAVFVYSTCVAGLIGDDLEAICKKAAEGIGKPVVPFYCEGFRGVSQSLGHHIANKKIFDSVVGTAEPDASTPYDICIVGEFNIDGDAWIVKPLFERIGCRALTVFTGNASYADLPVMHRSKLNAVNCQRSSTYIAQMIKDKYGVPFINISLFGMEQTAQALRDTAKFFGLEESAERVISEETAKYQPKIDHYKARLEGKKCAIYQGAPRAWHWIKPMKELGIDVIMTATTFGHQDDYEKILAKVDEGHICIDNPNALELEEYLVKLKPDFFIGGLKEKYFTFKLGIPFINGHSYEEGPYAGFEGFVNFARDIDIAINTPVWKLVRKPLEAE
jgi:nitrogenase molybdenum-iron protein alpha chain